MEGNVSSKSARMAIGAVTVAVGIAYLAITQSYSFGELARPGPALFPTLIGAGLVLIGVLLVVRAARGHDLDEGEERLTTGYTRLTRLSGLLVAYFVGLLVMGYTASSIGAMLVLLHVLEADLRLRARIIYSVTVVLATELMFTAIFDIGFHGGLFNFLR